MYRIYILENMATTQNILINCWIITTTIYNFCCKKNHYGFSILNDSIFFSFLFLSWCQNTFMYFILLTTLSTWFSFLPVASLVIWTYRGRCGGCYGYRFRLHTRLCSLCQCSCWHLTEQYEVFQQQWYIASSSQL